MHFLTYTLFRKCNLSKMALALVSLIPLSLCSRCNLRPTQSTSPRWQPVPEHSRTEALTHCCVLCNVPLNQPPSPHVLIMAKDAISLFLSLGHFLFKKPLIMLLLLLLQTLCCASPVSQNTLLKKFSCCFSVSFHRRRTWGRCRHEIWSTSSQWGYQDRRPPIITFTPEG